MGDEGRKTRAGIGRSAGEQTIDRRLIRRLAGRRVYIRGEEYAQWGLVLDLPGAQKTGEALVAGTRTYRVRLWREAGQVRFHCDCPQGEAARFCKHVAAVGFAQLDRKNGADQVRVCEKALEQAINLLCGDMPDPLGHAWRGRVYAMLDGLLEAGSARAVCEMIERALGKIAEARWDRRPAYQEDEANAIERRRFAEELCGRRITAGRALGLETKSVAQCFAERREGREQIGEGAAAAADHSESVRLWLEAGETEAAWRAAQAGDCSEELWRKLAARRIRQKPPALADALAVYRRLIERKLQRKNRYDYADVLKLLRRVRRLMKRMGQEAAFAEYLAGLRRQYSRRKGLRCLLDRLIDV